MNSLKTPAGYSADELERDNPFNMDDVDAPEEDDEPSICTACSGSGEGPYDGTTCRVCKGRGES